VSIDSLISHYGLLAVGIGAGIEGETVVASGGLFAHRQLLPLPGVIAAAALGSSIVDQVFFLIGRYSRDSRIARKLMAAPAYDRAMRFIEKRPSAFVFAFRFLWGLRTASPIALGTSAISWRRFALLNVLAATLWAAVIACVGFGFSASLGSLGANLYKIEHFALAIIALGGILGLSALLARRIYQRSQ
jgi:membrane protein DedA with SNARE-associated domain